MSDKYGIENVMDSKWMTPKISFEFFHRTIANNYRNDPCINVVNEKIVYQGLMVSPMVVVDYRDETYHVGVDEMSEAAYTPKEDLTAAEMVFQYADAVEYGGDILFPDIPLCPPIIPQNQYWRAEKMYSVETFMAAHNCVLVDPSIGFINEMDSYPVATIKEGNNMPVLDDFDYDQPFFFPYKRVNFKDPEYRDRRIIYMEFNPFHPMSIHYLVDFEWNDDETVVTGHYKYKDGVRPFTFSLKSKAFRIHSHLWLKFLKSYRYDGMIESYDLCANFDFLSVLGLEIDAVDTFIEPLMIEPVIYTPRDLTKEKKDHYDEQGRLLGTIKNDNYKNFVRVGGLNVCYPYSLMTGNYVTRGVKHEMRCMYTHIGMKAGDMKYFLDVTKQCTLYERFLRFGKHNVSLIKGELDSHDLFLRLKDRGRFRVFLRVDTVIKSEKNIRANKKCYVLHGYVVNGTFCSKKDMAAFISRRDVQCMYESEVKYDSFPRNRFKGLMSTLKCITLREAFRMEKKDLHVYMPMLTPYDDSLGNVGEKYGYVEYNEMLEKQGKKRENISINDMPVVEDYDIMDMDDI